jgi:hypothetical protein
MVDAQNKKSNAKVDALSVTVTKPATDGLKTTTTGKLMLKVGALHETETGDKVWVDLLAFGLLAKNLEKALSKKGARAKIYGNLKESEYTKKDGGVGVNTAIFVSKARVVVDDKVVTIDEFTELPAANSPF